MATLPVFRTWTAGEIVTAAFMNTNIRDPGGFFLSWPVCELRQTIAQSLASASFVPITFDTEEVDTDGWHSTVTNTDRITPQTAGRVQLFGGGSIQGNATGRRVAAWYLNSVEINGSRFEMPSISAAANWVGVVRPRTVFCNGSTDVLQLQLFQNSGGSLLTTGAGAAAGEECTASARLIGTT